ncbi:type II secretion system protein H [Chitinivorax tropicus]|uniref:Type II secretion system protein H n=1 Tax=Chitinivorax tropicus TaxID=714531 RepID=A0A840ML68_9PROT|nr:GspH/FimT family pseudopilin [Chitinivorax tropicus]MBB5017879.1 type II secretion system protein H [Chitinivorax tropicus]
MSALRAARDSRGFTLIEIIVVVLIISIVITLAAVRLDPGQSRQLRDEAERLALLFETARDEAVASGEPIGWATDGTTYRFYRRENNDWVAFDAKSDLHERTLPDAMHIDQIQMSLQPLPADGRLLFMPSGVNELFAMRFALGEKRLKLRTDVLGRVFLEDQPDAVN